MNSVSKFVIGVFVLMFAHLARGEEPTPEMKQAMEGLQRRTARLLQGGSPLLPTHKGMLLYLPVKAARSIYEVNRLTQEVRNREAALDKISAAPAGEGSQNAEEAGKKQVADLANAKKQVTGAHNYLAAGQAELTNTFAAWTDLVTSLEAGKNVFAGKQGRFEWAYCSNVDGSGQPMIIQLPEKWDGKTPQPAVLSLHGYMADHNQEVIRVKSEVPHFELNVNGRGSPYYRLMGEDDVLEALDFLQANYPVDPDRIYLYGWSMGGWGCHLFATRHTDRFAGLVSVSGWAFGLPMENMLTIPAQFYAGQDDRIIPVSTMQVQMLKFKRAGAHDISLFNYPSPSGHDVYPIGRDGTGKDPNKPLEFLFQHRRNPFPERLRFTTDLSFPGNYYWLKVDRLLDAHVDGKVDLTARDGTIDGVTSNIERLQISALNKWLTAGRPITLDGQSIRIPVGLDQVTLTRRDSKWSAQQEVKQETAPVYRPGGMFAIGDGQPIKLVAAENWESVPNLKKALDGWRSMGDLIPTHVVYLTNPLVMTSWLPVTAASDASLQKADSHLVLVGGPEENPVVKQLLPSWPVTFDEKTVTIRSLGTFPKDKVAIELNFYHPQNPKVRTVWLYNQSQESFPVRTPMMASPSVNTLPDICVQNVENRSRPYVIAAANFGNDWVLPEAPKDEARLPESINTFSLLETALAEAARDHQKADATFRTDHVSPKNGAVGRLTLPSLKAYVPHGLAPLMRATLTQAQFKELQAALETQPNQNQDKTTLELVKPQSAHGEKVTIVFGDSTVWGLSNTYRYFFPEGTLEYVAGDLYDYLGQICASK